MNTQTATVVRIIPAASGWQLLTSGQALDGVAPRAVASLEEAPALLESGQIVHLALPGRYAHLERLVLPSLEASELGPMVELQLEKALPYPVTEASSGYELISQEGAESTLLSMAVNVAQLEQLCAALRESKRLPAKVSLYAADVASTCAAGETVLCVWRETDQIGFAFCQNGKLGFFQETAACDNGISEDDLSQLMLSAEMEGAPTQFDRIRLDKGCAELEGLLLAYFGKSPELVTLAELPGPGFAGNLMPASWEAEASRFQRSERLRGQLQIAAAVYLVALAGAFVYLAVLKSKVRKLDQEILRNQPQIEQVQAAQTRWNALAPAINPSRSTLEVLFRVYNSLPNSEVKITTFEHSPSEFRVEGEVASANQAIEFRDKLEANKEISEDYKIQGPPPGILPTGGAHYNIFGKLKL